MRLARQVLIDAPPARVWALIDDDRNLALWMPNLIGTRFPDGRPDAKAGASRVGTRFIQTLQVEGGGTSEYAGEVTEYKPGQMLGTRLTPQAFTVDVRYYVTADPEHDGTALVYTCRTRANTWYGWGMLMIGSKMLGPIADAQLAALRRAAEDPDVVVYGAPKARQA